MSEWLDSIALKCALDAIANETGDPLVRAKVKGLLIGYDAKWRGVQWETLSVEEVYQLPLINPDTGRASRTFTHAGKFDGIIRYVESGRKYLLEHKTCSEDIEDPDSTYWRRLTIDSQVSAYVLASWQRGEKLDGTSYDVVRKPGIRPKEITGESFRTLVQNGTYFGFPVPDKARRTLKREDEELYSLRLARECLDNPARYYQRRTIPRLDAEVAEYADELWSIGQSIIETRRTGRHYRNPAACVQFNSACEYLPICCGEDTPDSDRWQRVASLHEELPGLEGDGKDVLTNSRIRCYALCKRKHQLRYELGVRRRDEEEREALAFGNLWHLAMEKWWLCYSKKGSENVNDRKPAAVNAVAAGEKELVNGNEEARG